MCEFDEDLEDLSNSDSIRDLISSYEESEKNNTELYFDVDDWLDMEAYYIDNDEFDKANKLISKALVQHEEDMELLLSKAECLMELGENEELLEVIEKIEELAPYTKSTKLFRIGILIDNKEYEEAFSLIESWDCEEDYKSYKYFYKMECLDNFGDIERAFESLKLFMLNADMTADVYDVFITRVLSWGKEEEALEFIKSCLSGNAYDLDIWKLLFVFYIGIGRGKSAFETNEYIIFINPAEVRAHTCRLILLEYSNYEDICESVDFLIAHGKEDEYYTTALNSAAFWFTEHLYEQEASKCFKETLNEAGSSSDKYMVYKDMGNLKMQTGNYKEAIRYLEFAKDIAESKPEMKETAVAVYEMLTSCYENILDEELSEKYFFKTVALGTKNETYIYRHIMSYCMMGEVEKAEAFLAKYGRENIGEAEQMILEGIMLYYTSKTQQAIDLFVNALELKPWLCMLFRETLQEMKQEPLISQALDEYFE